MEKSYFNNKESVSEFLNDFNRVMLSKVMNDGVLNTANNFEDAEFAIAIYKDKGMSNTRQLLYGTPIEVLVTIVSLLENVINLDIFSKEDTELLQKDIKKLINDLLGKEN